MKLPDQYRCDWCKLSTAEIHQTPTEWIRVQELVSNESGHLSHDFCSVRCSVLFLERWVLRDNGDAIKIDLPGSGKAVYLRGHAKSPIDTAVVVMTADQLDRLIEKQSPKIGGDA